MSDKTPASLNYLGYPHHREKMSGHERLAPYVLAVFVLSFVLRFLLAFS